MSRDLTLADFVTSGVMLTLVIEYDPALRRELIRNGPPAVTARKAGLTSCALPIATKPLEAATPASYMWQGSLPGKGMPASEKTFRYSPQGSSSTGNLT